jgi:hypothetical protein
MMEEYQSIMKNDVWEVVPRPEGKSVVTSKWIYKASADNNIEKYKARFVARGFSQKEGEDYDETFAPVAKYTSIKSIIAIASVMGWKLHQMDVKTAFLNGVHRATIRFCDPWEGVPCVQIEGLVRIKAGT